MSDYIVKLIPEQLQEVSEQQAAGLRAWLQHHIASEKIIIQRHASIVFVDCGSQLERILCPVCGAEQSMEWWGTEMQRAFEESGFQNLRLHMPCCHSEASLHDLCYDMPCGFSSFEADIWNPAQFTDADLKKLNETQGIMLRRIDVHI